jgi:ABC-2 type transport system permease protein
MNVANGVRVARLAVRVGLSEFTNSWNLKTWVTGWLLGVLAQVAFFALLGKLIDSEDRFHYLLIGNALAAGCFQANIAVAVSTWDRGDGTYPLLVIAPSSLVPAIIGRCSSYLVGGIGTAICAFVFIRVFFDLPMPWPSALLVAPLIVLTCMSSFFLACFLGAFVCRLPRTRNIVHRFETIGIMIFCGVSVPVAFWPGWVEVVANVLPVTHGLQAIRLVLAEAPASRVLEQVGLELLVGLAWLGLASLIIDKMADAGRRDGSIELM